jgi:hypothetical protein
MLLLAKQSMLYLFLTAEVPDVFTFMQISMEGDKIHISYMRGFQRFGPLIKSL